MKKIIAAAWMICALMATGATQAQTKRTTKHVQTPSAMVNTRTAKGTAATKKIVKDVQVNAPMHNSKVATTKKATIKK